MDNGDAIQEVDACLGIGLSGILHHLSTLKG